MACDISNGMHSLQDEISSTISEGKTKTKGAGWAEETDISERAFQYLSPL